ncbi:CCA tRNA nucleotidyltransferase [Paenibacillus lentus]|uniref:CCA tRNA nucleotidyltransferase n=1 Tax=Paenibacillus lentus TaxID=1338368 RepID=A0A3Q8S5A6_9BACL|nr:CCA tRNA nucleotidyltransferase [Paenibacillus lentus]AZK47203.1 CCA tRNA nucleotidyltransferase [Paenibacillus lentus]
MYDWKQVDPLMQHQGEKVLKTLVKSGHSAYFVGGCVRDELMGRPVHDMDIATSAKPESVMDLFERTIPTGLQHGTVTVVMGDYPFEVTTFRKESHYEDHRHPAAVEFVSGIVEDLQRRDFTMNAMARSLEGELTDPFQGLSDIRKGVIRCVGKAEERFDEDALRMMRAIRFASVFGYRPVKSLWRALINGRDKITYVAIERIRAELERLLLGAYPLRGLELLRRSQLLHHAKAPFIEPCKLTREGAKRLQALDYMPAEPQELRWSMLLQGLAIAAAEAEVIMKEWTFSNQVAMTTSQIMRFDEAWNEIRASLEPGDTEQLRRSWVEIELQYGQTISRLWLDRQSRWLAYLGEEDRAAQLRLQKEEMQWHLAVPVHDLKELAIRGGDVLTTLGLKGGPWLGELMKRLLLLVAVGDVPNEKEALLEYVKAVVK